MECVQRLSQSDLEWGPDHTPAPEPSRSIQPHSTHSLLLHLLLSCVCAELLQLCRTLLNTMDVAHQALLSLAFSKQEKWSGLP